MEKIVTKKSITITCRDCQRSSLKSDLKVISSPCGGTVCLECFSSHDSLNELASSVISATKVGENVSADSDHININSICSAAYSSHCIECIAQKDKTRLPTLILHDYFVAANTGNGKSETDNATILLPFYQAPSLPTNPSAASNDAATKENPPQPEAFPRSLTDTVNTILSELNLDSTASTSANPSEKCVAPDTPDGDSYEESDRWRCFDCPICFELLFDPVTSPCGHSFCRQCLARAIDHNPCCPVCRAPLMQHSAQLSRPTDLLIQHLTRTLLPKSYRLRALKEAENLLELEKNLPIFVCSWTFPKLPIHLHVFEPRYRLMMRRAMEGQRMFGMAAHTKGGCCRYGTLLRIEELQMLQDGRSLIVAVGVRKFVMNDTGMQDGYLIANVTYIDDDEDFNADSSEVKDVMGSIVGLLQAILEGIPVITRYQLVHQLGPIPTDDPITLPYWVVSFTRCPQMIMETLYASTDPLARLILVHNLLTHLHG